MIWKIRNTLRWNYIKGWVQAMLAPVFTGLLGGVAFVSELRATHIKADGSRESLGVIGRRVVTTAFVNYMADSLQGTQADWINFKYHDCGTGTTAEAAGDTGMETAYGGARSTGSQTEGASANIYKSVGTVTFSGSFAITEHGLFNASTAGTLMDRTVFSARNVASGDSIEFTYQLTITAGG